MYSGKQIFFHLMTKYKWDLEKNRVVFSVLQGFRKNSKDVAYATCKPRHSSTAISHSEFYETRLKKEVAISAILSFFN